MNAIARDHRGADPDRHRDLLRVASIVRRTRSYEGRGRHKTWRRLHAGGLRPAPTMCRTLDPRFEARCRSPSPRPATCVRCRSVILDKARLSELSGYFMAGAQGADLPRASPRQPVVGPERLSWPTSETRQEARQHGGIRIAPSPPPDCRFRPSTCLLKSPDDRTAGGANVRPDVIDRRASSNRPIDRRQTGARTRRLRPRREPRLLARPRRLPDRVRPARGSLRLSRTRGRRGHARPI